MISFLNEQLIFYRGEIFSESSARQRVLRRRPREDEDRPLGQKVDGLFTSGGTEVGIVELSGGPQTADLPRYIKDHIRGLWSMRDLLNDITVGPDFSSGSFAEMRYVQVFFFHTHGKWIGACHSGKGREREGTH